MKPDMFREPVSILVGLGFPAEIRSVMDAYRHLAEWPAGLRDNAHSVALKACGAALRGEIEAETFSMPFLSSLTELSGEGVIKRIPAMPFSPSATAHRQSP